MMKVCIVTTAFPRWKNDTRAPFVLEAAKAIKHAGLDVKVIAMHNPGAKNREFLDGVEVIRPNYLPNAFEVLQKESGGLPESWEKNPLTRFAILPFFIVHTIVIINNSLKADLIHANWTLSAAAARFGWIFHRKPIVVTVQGSDIFRAVKTPLFRYISQWALRGCKKVIALSQALANEVHEMGIPEQNIVVIPNGVDADSFFPESEDRENIILFVGALTETKGGDVLIRAMPEVIRSFPDYSLVIVGDGPKRLEWEKLAEKMGVRNNLYFTGNLIQFEVGKYMKRAKLFVIPSRSEGLGVVLLEALASGIPCIGSCVGGIPDILDHGIGSLVPPDNEKALAHEIIEFLSDKEKLLQLSRKSRQYILDNFRWDLISRRIINVYEEILSLNNSQKQHS